ncbi:MAG TPA: FG-GAP-like repeat-containing protein, partial [Chitinophagaceae bacterium]|nr:FG-GAP-like repeat-containing protein [Chitinophagaceae bacterium]
NHIALGDLDNDGKLDLAATNFTGETVSLFRNRIGEPVIESFTPAAAEAGETVTISGYAFTGASEVLFGGVKARSFQVVDAQTIRAVVDTGQSGRVSVRTAYGVDTKDLFLFKGPPAIESFFPASGTAGSTITVKGRNLFFLTSIEFGGTPAASFTVISPTEVQVNLAAGSSGAVKLINPLGTASRNGFTYRPAPEVNGFAPRSGPVGSSVVIQGKNFSPGADSTTVFIGGIRAQVTAATATQITVKVPAGTNDDLISVTTGAGRFTAHAADRFTTTFTNSDTSWGVHLFAPPQKIMEVKAQERGRMVSGDLDGDGKTDFLYSVMIEGKTGLRLYRNTTTGDALSFALDTVLPSVNGSIQAYSLGDMDGDGRQDLVVSGGSLAIFFNRSLPGKILFSEVTEIPDLTVIGNLEVADLDGDGKADLAGSSFAGVFLYRNTGVPGRPGFAPTLNLGLLHNSTPRFYIQDLDGDRKPELLAYNLGSESFLPVWKNNSSPGSLSFQRVELPKGGLPYGYTLPADLDRDGKADLLTMEQAGDHFAVLRNHSTGGNLSFTHKEFSPEKAPGGFYPLAADFDGDGRRDLALYSTGTGGDLHLYRNEEKDTGFHFSAPFGLSGEPYSAGFQLLATDFTGDGRPDLLYSGWDHITAYVNQAGKVALLRTCEGDTLTVSAKSTGSTYQWQQLLNGTFANLT